MQRGVLPAGSPAFSARFQVRSAMKARSLQRFRAGEKVMAVQWIKDVDTAFARAKQDDKPLLIDFSAAPA
jgi:hypothetical protein